MSGCAHQSVGECGVGVSEGPGNAVCVLRLSMSFRLSGSGLTVDFPSVMDDEHPCGSSGGSGEGSVLLELWRLCCQRVALLVVVLMNVVGVGRRISKAVTDVMRWCDVAAESVVQCVSDVAWSSVPVFDAVASAMGVLAVASLFVGRLLSGISQCAVRWVYCDDVLVVRISSWRQCCCGRRGRAYGI